jgi:hypothetical protein
MRPVPLPSKGHLLRLRLRFPTSVLLLPYPRASNRADQIDPPTLRSFALKFVLRADRSAFPTGKLVPQGRDG